MQQPSEEEFMAMLQENMGKLLAGGELDQLKINEAIQASTSVAETKVSIQLIVAQRFSGYNFANYEQIEV
jgi:hypothetical protein